MSLSNEELGEALEEEEDDTQLTEGMLKARLHERALRSRRRSTRSALTARAKSLAKRFGIEVYDGAGAFKHTPDLMTTEFVMHELAHVITAKTEVVGVSEGGLSVPVQIEDLLASLSASTQNSLEIDTSYVVWKTGELLGIWSSDYYAYKIAYSCAENCQAPPKVPKLLSVEDIRDEWESRAHDRIFHDMVMRLHDLMTGEFEEQGEELNELPAAGDVG